MPAVAEAGWGAATTTQPSKSNARGWCGSGSGPARRWWWKI